MMADVNRESIRKVWRPGSIMVLTIAAMPFCLAACQQEEAVSSANGLMTSPGIRIIEVDADFAKEHLSNGIEARFPMLVEVSNGGYIRAVSGKSGVLRAIRATDSEGGELGSESQSASRPSLAPWVELSGRLDLPAEENLNIMFSLPFEVCPPCEEAVQLAQDKGVLSVLVLVDEK